MNKIYFLVLSLMLVAGCNDPGPDQGRPKGDQSRIDAVRSLVLEHGAIRFADGTGIELNGVVQQEIFTKVPDVNRLFRYQQGVRRTVRLTFADNVSGVIGSISDVMKKGGYTGRFTQPKDGVTVVRFVKKGFPVVNVRFESVSGKKAPNQTAVIFNWII